MDKVMAAVQDDGTQQSMLQRAREVLAQQRKDLRPAAEFLARPSNPKTAAEVTRRVRHNVPKFWANYVLVTLALAAYALITSPLLLIALIVLYAGVSAASIIRSREEPFAVMGLEVNSNAVLMATGVLGLVLLYAGSATSTIFWLLGASGVTVAVHAALLSIPAPEALAESA